MKKTVFFIVLFYVMYNLTAQTTVNLPAVQVAADVSNASISGEESFKETSQNSNIKDGETKGRPKVALVLGGGGAKGFAHIPVLEAIEELGIPIDMVIGTSIGSVVGGLYCSGYSVEEIKNLFMTMEWSTVFQDSTVTSFERLLGSHSTYASPFSVKLGSNLSLKMGSGLLTGQNAYKMLKEKTVKIPSYIDFDDLPVPFRATAVNLLTGEYVLEDSGDLAESIRSSMSIPAVFEPFEMNGKLYVDGGARENVPILVAKEMGYDIVIAVDISQHLTESADDFKEIPVMTLWQMLNMPQAAQTKEANSYADLVITPQIDQYTLLSFEKGTEIYEQSKKDVEKCMDKLREIKDRIYSSGDYSKEDASNNTYSERKWLVPTEIQLKGAVSDDIKRIKTNFDTDIKNKELTQQKINSLIDDIYYTGNYNRVIARTKVVDGSCILELDLDAKQAESGLILLGGAYAGTFSTDTNSCLTFDTNFQYRGLTGPGSAFSIKFSMLNVFKAELVYLQPISSIAYFQLAADYGVNMNVTSNGLDSWDSVVYRDTASSATFLLGAAFDRNNTLLVGGGIKSIYTNSLSTPAVAGEANIQYTFNNLTSQAFPVKGVYVSATGKEVIGIEPNYDSLIMSFADIDMTFAFPITSKLSIVSNIFVGTNFDQMLDNQEEYWNLYSYSVYDRRFFPHVSGNYKSGLHKAAFSGSIQVKPKESLTIAGGQLTLAVTGAAGNVWNDYNDLSINGLIWRGSLDIGLQIQKTFSIVFRAGVGTSHDKVTPFASFDFGNIRY